MLDAKFLLNRTPPKPATHWVIGLSGGLDSTALLHLCVQYRDQYNPKLKLTAVHVNHGLAAAADDWQVQCQQLCDQLKVSFHAASVEIIPESGASIEQVARRERYRIFHSVCGDNTLLLLGHHMDDQVETLLYRLARGSGPTGLRGMDEVSYHRSLCIWRPLLDVGRPELETYVRSQGLTWVNDPSNRDITFDRNYIRHEVIPLLKNRWPAIRKTLQRTSRLAAETSQLASDLAEIDLSHAQQNQQLAIAQLQNLTEPRLRNALRHWLAGQDAPMPSEKVLEQIQNAVTHYHSEQETEIAWGNAGRGNGQRWQVKTFQGLVWQLPEPQPIEPHWQGRLSLAEPVSLPAGLGTLEMTQIPSVGDLDDASASGFYLNDAVLEQPLVVKFRQGAEMFRPVGRKQKRLKKWLYEWGVPPWKRDRIPLLFSGETLVAVPGYGVAEAFSAKPGQPGVQIRLITASVNPGVD